MEQHSNWAEIQELEREKERLQDEMEQELATVEEKVKKDLLDMVQEEQARQEEEKIMRDPIRAAFYREPERRREIAERFFKKPGQ